MRPLTNAIGKTAAMMVNVARIDGLPTSATASTAIWTTVRPRLPAMRMCLAIFSTTTMASSTRMPMEKMSANRVIRLSVYPYR
jgi:hypothetical protein